LLSNAIDLNLTANIIAHRAEHSPDRALVQHVGRESMTYGEFNDAVLRWASLFESLGLRRGDTVASMAKAPAAFAPWLGAGWLRAIYVPLNPELRGQLLVEAMQMIRAKVIVIEADNVDHLARVAGRLTDLVHVVILPGTEHSSELPFNVHRASELLAAAAPRPWAPVTGDDIECGIFTSGTSGASKCVLRNWAIDERSGKWLFPNDIGHRTPTGAYYSPWPPFHGLGLTAMAVSVQRDMRLVVRQKFSVEHFWSDIRDYGCTHSLLLVVAPLIAQRIPVPEDSDNPLLYLTIVPLVREYRELERRFGVRINTMYGQSETGPVLSTDDPVDYTTAGTPIPDLEVMLVDSDGAPSAVGAPGELIVKPDRPQLMSDVYLGMPEAMNEKWRSGWFHTGDVFRADAAGNYSFVDRLKDSIRHRGHNLSSIELEREIQAHPAVAECACVGVPSDLAEDEIFGDEDIKAVVVRRSHMSLSGEELTAFLADRVPPYMLPRYIEFTSALPKTATNKVRKDQLRALTSSGSVWRRS
jgi:crotonobetaine/carnitine-CoA ligase